MPEPSILDARLAEIDRRLRTIQSGLAPAAEPGPPPRAAAPPPVSPSAPPPPGSSAAVSAPPPPGSSAAVSAPAVSPSVQLAAAPSLPPPAGADLEASRLLTRLRELTEAHQQLLAGARELLAGYTDASSRRPAAPAPLRPAGPVSVAAGPFTTIEALRRFESSVSELPEVREVVLREYVGEDRAVLEVHLFGPTS
jgi:hypothetical protein